MVIPTADYPPIEGGIATVALQVSRELAALGHEVTVIAPRFPGMEAFDESEPARVLRYRGYGAGWLRALPMVRTAWPALRSADLVLAINVASGGLLGMAARALYGKPYAVFAYGYEFLKFGPRTPFGWLLRRVYAHASSVVAISGFTRDKLVAYGVPADRVFVCHPGAGTKVAPEEGRAEALRYRYVLEGKRVILSVGRLVRRKGHLTLIESMPEVLARVPEAHLVIVGRGPMMSACSRKAQELGIRDRVSLAGHLPDGDVAGLYELCDVFALPAGEGKHGQVEGFGLVFAEAHAFGKPVVAGRSGGIPDAVTDGETGLLVEPEDPAALAEALLRILTDGALAKRLGENGRRRVEAELNWTAFTAAVLRSLEPPP